MLTSGGILTAGHGCVCEIDPCNCTIEHQKHQIFYLRIDILPLPLQRSIKETSPRVGTLQSLQTQIVCQESVTVRDSYVTRRQLKQ